MVGDWKRQLPRRWTTRVSTPSSLPSGRRSAAWILDATTPLACWEDIDATAGAHERENGLRAGVLRTACHYNVVSSRHRSTGFRGRKVRGAGFQTTTKSPGSVLSKADLRPDPAGFADRTVEEPEQHGIPTGSPPSNGRKAMKRWEE